jgi:hypothetical protein
MRMVLDIQSKSIEDDKGSSDILKRKFDSVNYKMIENFLELSENLPKQNEMYMLWTIKQFNAFSIIMTILNEHKYIDELTVSSYNIARKSVSGFVELLNDKKIGKINLFVSDVAKSMFPKSFELLNEVSVIFPNISVSYVWNHSKVALIQANNNYFVCEGSGNFSYNARHEQYLLINSQSVYEFRRNNITSMAGK